MKKILIATPCLNQKVDAYYTHSLVESIKLGLKRDLNLNPIFLANESILPMARNELINLAYHEQYETMVFIDDDEYWDPKILIEIIESDKDVITVPVVNKGDKKIEYNIYYEKIEQDSNGYFEVKSTGTGFLKLSKKVIVDLWESNTELVFRNKKLKNICEYTFINGSFVGEDITLSRKIKELGYKIWVNPNHTVSHIGNKMYKGNFLEHIKK